MVPVILQGSDGKLFAVGLQWKRIVITEDDASGSSNASERSAYSIASSAKSNRLVFTRGGKNEVKAVGHGKFDKHDFGALSLAQAVTLRFDNKVKCVVAIALPDQRVWVCAIAEGMVVNGFDFVESAAEASQRVRDFAKRYPEGSIAYYGDLLPDSQYMNLQELQEIAVAHESCAMAPVRKNELERKRLILIGVGILALGVAKVGFDKYQAHKQAEAARLAAEASVPQVSAQEAWDKGVAQWLESSSQATPNALSQVLGAVQKIPLDISTWTFKAADCNRAGKQWACTVQYERIPGLRGSTESFLASIPGDWKASWGAMDKASATFTTQAEANKVDLAMLVEAPKASLPLLSHFQSNSRAFIKLDIGPAAAVPITPAPQPDGKPTVVDPSTIKPVIVSMEVTAAGPLRSMHVLTGQQISWRVLKFARTDKITPDSPEKSVLMVTEAKGDIYALK